MKTATVLAIAGVALVTAAVWMVWHPLAPLFIGAACLRIAYVLLRGELRKEKAA